MSFRAVDGNAEAFGAPVEGSTHFAGIQRVCLEMRELIGDPAPPARIQDPYGLRVLPQVHGAFWDRLDSLHLATVAMANAGPNTNGSQFFVVVGPQGQQLPKQYTIFGQVSEGMDVVQRIAAVAVDVNERGEPSDPVDPVVIASITISES